MSEAILGPLLLGGAVVGVVLLFGAMARGARRGTAEGARQLGLSEDPGGFAGVVDGIALRVLANHVVPRGDGPPAEAVTPVASFTGEILLVTRVPHPLPFPLLLESTAPGGRRHRSGRVPMRDAELDAAYSLLTTHPYAAARIVTTPALRAALLDVHAKVCCLIEADSFQVTLHGGHYRRTAELGRDAVAMARALGEASSSLVSTGPRVALPSAAGEARLVACTPLAGVRAASAIVRAGARFLIVQDDHAGVAVLDPATGEVAGEPRRGGPLPKAVKPDWEAAFTADDGTVYLLGSGSTAARRRIDELPVDGGRRRVHAERLYDALTRALEGLPNVEGAVRLGERVTLFHRGSGPRPSATVDVPLSAFAGEAVELETPRPYDLGTVDGVPLHFTDAALHPDGGIAFLAAAEDTADAVADGPVRGAALGVIDARGVRLTLLCEADGTPSRRKFEGMVLSAGGGWLVTDPDDPDTPSSLCRFEWRGRW